MNLEPPKKPMSKCSLDVIFKDKFDFKFKLFHQLNCSYQNIYVMGNYLKFSRIMSQTPWKVDDKMLVL